MNKEKITTLDAAQGAGTMSAPESEISNIATVTIDKLNDKDEVVETEELKLEVVDEDTKDWQHTFWNVMWLASRTKPAPTTTPFQDRGKGMPCDIGSQMFDADRLPDFA